MTKVDTSAFNPLLDGKCFTINKWPKSCEIPSPKLPFAINVIDYSTIPVVKPDNCRCIKHYKIHPDSKIPFFNYTGYSITNDDLLCNCFGRIED